MYGIAVKEETSMANFFDTRLFELLDEMFICIERIGTDNAIETQLLWEQKKKQMSEIYQEVMDQQIKSGKLEYGVPTLENILEAVYERNDMLENEIVALDVQFGSGCRHSFRPTDTDDPEEIQEECGQAWDEDIGIATEYGNSIDELVVKVLAMLDLSFKTSEETTGAYFEEDWPDGSDVFVNDCQNLLIPEWHLELLSDYNNSLRDEERLLVRVVSHD